VSQDRQRLHAVVHGRVQGVNFRYFTYMTAQQYGVVGWVRNLPEGTVESVAEGNPSVLQAFLDALHEGPPAAKVSHVDAEFSAAEDDFSDFSIRYV